MIPCYFNLDNPHHPGLHCCTNTAAPGRSMCYSCYGWVRRDFGGVRRFMMDRHYGQGWFQQ